MKTIHDPLYVRLIDTLQTKRLKLGLTQEEVGKRMDSDMEIPVPINLRHTVHVTTSDQHGADHDRSKTSTLASS